MAHKSPTEGSIGKSSHDRLPAAPTFVLFRRRLFQYQNWVRFLTEAPHERSGRCGPAESDRSPAANSAVIFCAHLQQSRIAPGSCLHRGIDRRSPEFPTRSSIAECDRHRSGSVNGCTVRFMARAAQIAQIIIWVVILVLGALAYWKYFESAPMD